MVVLRHHLRIGLAAIISLFIISIVFDVSFPDPLHLSKYHSVDANRIRDNPELYENVDISTSVTVKTVNDTQSDGYVMVETNEEIALRYPITQTIPNEGNVLFIRGTSYLVAFGYVDISESYLFDRFGANARSIPGIVLFVLLFFCYFRIDFDRLAFVRRRQNHA